MIGISRDKEYGEYAREVGEDKRDGQSTKEDPLGIWTYIKFLFTTILG